MALRFFLYLMISEVYARCVPEFYGLIMVRSEPLAETAHICDMYMDEKRKSAEYVAGHIQDEVAGNVFMEKIDEERKYPKISFVEDRFHNDSVAIRSLFLQIPKIKR